MIIYIILSFFVGVIFGIFLSALCKASNDDFEKIEMLKKRDYIPELLRSKENRIEIDRIDESLVNDLIEDLEMKPKYTQYTIWYDGGEWFIGVKGNETRECKRLVEWLRGEILEKDKRRILQSIQLEWLRDKRLENDKMKLTKLPLLILVLL